MKKYDFGGWATKYNIPCSDGRTIMNNAFKHCDELKVPLVWNHNYSGPESVIGNAILKHADVGVYAYCEFNDTDTAKTAKNLVVHGDITSLSIYANKLQQKGPNVMHGEIKEVSLVLAGANPGACIQEVLVHGDIDETSALIYNDEESLELSHSGQNDEDLEHSATPENISVADVYNSMTDEQKAVVAIIADKLLEVNDEGEPNMKHNVFEQNKEGQEAELKHAEFMEACLKDAKKYGSLGESFMAHAETYGINNIDYLFPDPKNINNEPTLIDRDQSWVMPFFNALKKSPFSRLKSIYADITGDDARALGYVTGALKKDEVFGLLKRTTAPQTIYKKQKLDRDDIIDITDFDVVAFLKKEMRGKLNEEIVRAVLIGDGRLSSSADKIKEANIRPIFNDADLYTIKYTLNNVTAANQAKEFVKACIKSQDEYEGTGVPTLYCTPSLLSDMLLLEDTNGRFIYPDAATLARTLRVKDIVAVPVMKNLTRTVSTDTGVTRNVLGVIVNPSDYTIGADKGGAVSMFDDFDIDYNQQKYLIETRCSGSLLTPKTAITIENKVTN